MNPRPALTCVLGASLTALTPSQSPNLSMTPAVAPTLAGIVAPYTIVGSPGSFVALFADFGGGPTDLLGERFYLSLSSALTTLQIGVLPASGTIFGSIQAPLFAGLVGIVVHGQAIALDPSAPNGLFLAGNGESTAIHSGPGAIVAAFDNPVGDGFTGSFTADIEGHVRGGPVTRRTHDTGVQSAGELNVGIIGPLTPHGARAQLVYPAVDLGATGEPELITAIRWAVFSQLPVLAETFPQLQLRVGHTAVVPDFTVGVFSALPLFPNSGLSTVFANNEIPGAPPVLVYQGPYVIDPSQLVFHPTLPSIRYLPYPMAAPFAYDGTSSLLLDVRMPPSNAIGFNGSNLRIRVQSSPNPFARAVAAGTPGNPLNPATATSATVADCGMTDLQIEFTRVQTFALSPWLDAGTLAPDYGTPVVAQSLPPGTSVQVEYRGSAFGSGSTTTAWSPLPDIADAHRFLQFRIVFRANLVTDERPLVDTLVVPLL